MKQRNLAKIATEQELIANDFVYSHLTPVSNRFELKVWKPSYTKFKSFTLYTKIVAPHHIRRVVKTLTSDFYYLTN
jgi:hypothetical protein